MGFAIDQLNTWTDAREFKVEADRTKAYAAATNDPLDGDTSGKYAPPIFAVVPVWDALVEANAAVAPSEAMATIVHGEQDIRFARPIVPGDVLSSKATCIGVHVKKSGTTLIAK